MATNNGEHGLRIARWMGPTLVKEAVMAECHQGEEAAYGTTRMPCAWSARALARASRIRGKGRYGGQILAGQTGTLDTRRKPRRTV